MKKILVLGLMLLFLISPTFGVTVDTKISGNVVSFSSIGFSTSSVITSNVVTFNAVTKHIKLTNMSTTQDCWVDLLCKDSTGKGGYLTTNSCVVLVPANGSGASPSTVEFDFATSNLGFTSKPLNTDTKGCKPFTGSVSQSDKQIHYVVTGDTKDF